jgi:hypothetical protein
MITAKLKRNRMTDDQHLSADQKIGRGERSLASMEGGAEAQVRERPTEAARLPAVKIPRAERFGDGLASIRVRAGDAHHGWGSVPTGLRSRTPWPWKQCPLWRNADVERYGWRLPRSAPARHESSLVAPRRHSQFPPHSLRSVRDGDAGADLVCKPQIGGSEIRTHRAGGLDRFQIDRQIFPKCACEI